MTNQTIIEDLTLVAPPLWWQNPWVWVGLLAVLAVGFYFFRRWWKLRPVPSPPAPVVDPGPPPHLEALRRLVELRQKHAQLSSYQAVTECSEILREYIGKRFDFSIRYQTTREFLGTAYSHPEWEAKPRAELGEFLQFFDRVKFAAETATSQETLTAIDFAEKFVRSCIPEGPTER